MVLDSKKTPNQAIINSELNVKMELPMEVQIPKKFKNEAMVVQ